MRYCEKLTKDTYKLMLELMRNTRKDGRERYIKLCEDMDRTIKSSVTQCTGSECSVPSKEADKLVCPVNTTPIGDYHTHPNDNITISRGDILHSAASRNRFFCIGTSNKNIVKCYGIKDRAIMEIGHDIRKSIDRGDMREVRKLGDIAENIMDMRKTDTESLNSESYWRNVLDVECKIAWNRSDDHHRKYIAKVTKE